MINLFQNIANSKMELKFDTVKAANWIPEPVLEKIKAKYRNRMSNSHVISIVSEQERSQFRNKAICEEKIRSLIEECSVPPTETSEEQKQKVKTLAKAYNERRIFEKKMHSVKKASRKMPKF